MFYFSNFYNLKKIENLNSKKYKIAVYTYNFGYYRKKLNKDIDNFKKYDNLITFYIQTK